MKSQPVWESYEPTPGNEKPLPRYDHVSVATEDRIIMFVPLAFALYPRYNFLLDSVVTMTTNMTVTTLGRLTFRRENGRSYNALGPFRLPVEIMLLSLSMMLCMSLVGTWGAPIWMICMPFSCRVSDLTC